MMYLNKHEISEGVEEITITYKKQTMDGSMLADMLDFVIDCYNETQEVQIEQNNL